MRCDQIAPYLPGFAGDELRPDTRAIVARHLSSCVGCTADSVRLGRARTALATLEDREVEAPPFLLDSILDAVGEQSARRMLPIPPIALADIAAVVSDHREAIASAAGTALVAAGAAYALWRAVRGRGTQQPATS